jgi:hypothetical protein
MSKSKFVLRIYHDHVTEGAETQLPAASRIVYCVSGNASLRHKGGTISIADDEACFSDQGAVLRGDAPEGARLWRWELVRPGTEPALIRHNSIKSVDAGTYEIEIDTAIKHFMRLDRVSFPPGGEALTHIHAAPGVRCLLVGNLLLDSAGSRYRVWPGDSWVEHGPDRVYARGSEKTPSSFVRAMIVPEAYVGRSTITYVLPEDKDKPKSQSYKRYLEEAITP